MSFDKIKAMRTAERCLAQGKIRAAITEYKRVVENDPKDFGTLNILGDLYIKNAEEQEAVGCFTQVADHYNTQGFSQKAIAVYNKISRLKPNSMEISAKLAQLYKSKGSFSEARTHYTLLAEQYQRNGQKIEALAIWKQIADLDPQDTATYLKIAEVYWQEEQKDEAASAFAEAGKRLSAQGQYESALAAYSRALEINRHDLKVLKGYVNAQIKVDCGEEAAQVLEKILEQQPYNRDILYLLIDCYIDSDNPVEAEKAVIKLVEQEPTNYPKFLDLVEVHLKNKDLDSATRILSMSSEHLLVGGQSEQFLKFTNDILLRNPEHLDALRLSVRYYGWNRDESELKKSLEKLAEIAGYNNSVEDERYALSQLVMIAPHEIRYAQRLQELKIQYGFEENEYTIADSNKNASENVPEFENFEIVESELNDANSQMYDADFGDSDGHFEYAKEEKPFELNQNGSSNGTNVGVLTVEKPTNYIVEGVIDDVYSNQTETAPKDLKFEVLKPADEIRLASELESVEFYIAQGYTELAEKTLNSLTEKYGNQLEIAELRFKMDDTLPPFATNDEPKIEKLEQVEKVEKVPEPIVANDFNDFRNELGLEESEQKSEGDYDTHYHTATAYHEMGLFDEAVREFQDAINIVKPNDGTRRFFQCANLLGHCFMGKAMPNLALMWYKRGLETVNLNEEEKQAIYYEIGNAYEIGEENEKAIEYFEKIYAENIDYRDISKRLKSLKVKK